MRGGRLQFDDPEEFDQLAAGGLLNKESRGGIHAGFPTAFSGNESIGVGPIQQSPAQKSSHQRIDSGQPFLIASSGPNRRSAEEWVAP